MSPQKNRAPSPSTATKIVQSRLDSHAVLIAHLDALARRDPRLAAAIAHAGEVGLRTSPSGFEGMARVVTGQQLSVASARAIWGRVEALGATTAAAFLAHDEPTLRAAGLSRSKVSTLRGLAEAEIAGEIRFAEIDVLPAEAAIAALTRLKGIGPWTAEIYLLFCTGHPDVFPGGDLALQKAVAHAFELPSRPDAKTLMTLAAQWSPHRGAAALMFWRYFSVMKAIGPVKGDWDAL